MSLKSLTNAFLIALILSVILLPVLMGASILNISEEDNFADLDDFLMINSFSVTWMSISLHQLPVLLGLGISIFALFVVYLGGRSKHRRFNDRTIDAANVLTFKPLKTARIRAVFNFLCFTPHPLHTNNYLIYFSTSILFSKKRSVKL